MSKPINFDAMCQCGHKRVAHMGYPPERSVCNWRCDYTGRTCDCNHFRPAKKKGKR